MNYSLHSIAYTFSCDEGFDGDDTCGQASANSLVEYMSHQWDEDEDSYEHIPVHHHLDLHRSFSKSK